MNKQENCEKWQSNKLGDERHTVELRKPKEWFKNKEFRKIINDKTEKGDKHQ